MNDAETEALEPVTVADGADRGTRRRAPLPTVPLTPTPRPRPRAPAPPLIPTVPLDAADDADARPGRRVGSLIVPLAATSVAWMLAWFVLLLMRDTHYAATAWLFGMRQNDDAGSFLVQRFVVAAAAGCIGGDGVAVGLLLTGAVRDRRAVVTLVVGWMVSYAFAHVAIYTLTLAFDSLAHLRADEYLTYAYSERSMPAAYTLARLVDVLPAILGGVVTAFVLRDQGLGLPIKPILGWTLAAVLAVPLAWLVANASDTELIVELLDGPRRNALTIGILMGLIYGLVGGGLTLSSLRQSR